MKLARNWHRRYRFSRIALCPLDGKALDGKAPDGKASDGKASARTAPVARHVEHPRPQRPQLHSKKDHELTNAGWIVVTAEFDWETIGEFNRNLDWFAGKAAPFAELDRVLARHYEYRGYCAVYSGRRSIHLTIVTIRGVVTLLLVRAGMGTAPGLR